MTSPADHCSEPASRVRTHRAEAKLMDFLTMLCDVSLDANSAWSRVEHAAIDEGRAVTGPEESLRDSLFSITRQIHNLHDRYRQHLRTER